MTGTPNPPGYRSAAKPFGSYGNPYVDPYAPLGGNLGIGQPGARWGTARGPDLYNRPQYNPGVGEAQGYLNYQHLADHFNGTPVQQWMDAVNAQKWRAAQAAGHAAAAGNNAPPVPQGTGGLLPQDTGSSSGGGGGGGGGIPNLGGLQAGINQQFDARVALLKQLLGTAHAGIGAVGNQVNSQLGGLAKDSSAEGKRIAADIAAQYARQRQTAGTDQAALLADLQRNGANVGVLQATNAQQNQNLAGEQGRQSALDSRLQQILGSSMANRQAGAVAATGGFQQQLDTKGALLQQQLDAQRAQAMQQLAVAAAGGGGRGRGGGGRGGGGRGGRGGGGGLTLSQAEAAYNFTHPNDAVVPGQVDINGLLRNVMGGDYAAPSTQGYANDLLNGADPRKLIANIRGRMVPGGRNSDLAGPIGNELLTLVNSYGRAQKQVGATNSATAANQNNRRAFLNSLSF